MSQDSDLGPPPEPQIEPGEPNPGGADAISYPDGAEAAAEDGETPPPVMRDLDPDSNPAVDDAMPDEMKQTEDTSTEATEKDADDAGEGDEGDEVDAKDEAPA
jgi:hypothetical protein